MSFIAFVDKKLLTFIAQLSLFLRQTLIYLSPKAPKRCKRNAIFDNLHRAKKIYTNFDAVMLSTNFKADYLLRFITSNVVKDFSKSASCLQYL